MCLICGGGFTYESHCLISQTLYTRTCVQGEKRTNYAGGGSGCNYLRDSPLWPPANVTISHNCLEIQSSMGCGNTHSIISRASCFHSPSVKMGSYTLVTSRRTLQITLPTSGQRTSNMVMFLYGSVPIGFSQE